MERVRNVFVKAKWHCGDRNDVIFLKMVNLFLPSKREASRGFILASLCEEYVSFSNSYLNQDYEIFLLLCDPFSRMIKER